MKEWAYLGDLVIPNGGSDSNVLHNTSGKNAIALMVTTGALTAAVGIRTSMDADSDVTPTVDLYVGATQVTVPASKTTVWSPCGGFGSIMAHSAGTEGAARTINVYALFDRT